MIEINKVYCENNLKTFARMSDEFLDMIITSPPYDDMDEDFNPIPKRGLRQYEGYTWDFKKIAQESYRTLKQGGVMVWVIGDPTINGSESLASSLQKIYFRKTGFNIHDTMIYHTHKPPMNDARYQSCFEYMFVLSKGQPSAFNPIMVPSKQAGKKRTAITYREKNGSLKDQWRGGIVGATKIKESIWFFNAGASKGTLNKYAFDHPASFPEQLANDHIISWSNEGDLLYDPFLGSGTTAKMAILNSRNFIGSEISQEYVDICNRRIADAYALLGKGPKITEHNSKTYVSQPLFGG